MGRRGVHLAHSGLAFRLFEQVPQVLQRNALLGQFLFDGIAESRPPPSPSLRDRSDRRDESNGEIRTRQELI